MLAFRRHPEQTHAVQTLQSLRTSKNWRAVAILLVITLAKWSNAQQVQFPSTSPVYPTTTNPTQLFPAAPPANTSWAAGAILAPSTAPVNSGTYPPPMTFPPATYGNPVVTPLGQPTSQVPWSNPAAYPGFPQGFGTTAPTSGSIYPNTNPPALYPGNSAPVNPFSFGNPAAANPYGYPVPSANAVYPYADANGNYLIPSNSWFNNPNGNVFTTTSQQVIRFFQGPRFRHSWIANDDSPNSVEINDSDVSLAFAIPRFFGSTQPLYLLPSYSSHLWEGPSNGTADLPGAAYSAFLDVGWQTDPIRTFGLETGIRLGVFTDYQTFNDDSFRILGKLIGNVRLTPTATGKLGVYWIDRNRIKLVPAGGIIWTPNPDTKFDLFFPEPKLSHYLTTFGRTDAWWYATGYFGGGTWSITRADDTEDSIDINDLRVMLGMEFGRNDALRAGQRLAFVEAGYAFQREIIYRIRPQDNLDLENSFVLRAGIGY